MKNKVHSLFDSDAERVTTSEMLIIVREIFTGLADENAYFSAELKRNTSNDIVEIMSLTRPLSSKETHGDIDFVYVPRQHVHFAEALKTKLGTKILKTYSNGDVYSILFDSKMIKKKVHVDFIRANVDNFATKLQYFSYNDFSGIVGIFSKKINFKYGSEGFFKRYRDKKGNWHDILISRDLMDGLEILGFDSKRFETIKTVDDIVEFMLSSALVDSKYFTHDEMNQSDRKSAKRPVIEYVISKIVEANKVATEHEDFYFVLHHKDLYNIVLAKMAEIDRNVSVKSNIYDGNWVMKILNIPSGPFVGAVLKYLHDICPDLDNTNEQEVMRLAQKYIQMNPQPKG